MKDNPSAESSRRAQWRPSCSLDMLRLRAIALTAVRDFFRDRGYLEVETPLLSHDIVVDAHLEPFSLQISEASEERLYLQTSPEAAMKRLLAAGSGPIYQITRSFRAGEIGARHNPEFTMIEWYGVGDTFQDQMKFVEELIGAVVDRCVQISNLCTGAAQLRKPYHSLPYDQCFERALGMTVQDLPDEELQRLVMNRTGYEVPADSTQQFGFQRDDLLNLLLAECVEPTMGRQQPEFMTHYPISQAALAVACDDVPGTACRFELYVNSLELCNGYQELSDADELQRRDTTQNIIRTQNGRSTLPGASLMLDAMRHGLPPCSGVALGFDRLLMAMTGLMEIDQVTAFPFCSA